MLIFLRQMQTKKKQFKVFLRKKLFFCEIFTKRDSARVSKSQMLEKATKMPKIILEKIIKMPKIMLEKVT